MKKGLPGTWRESVINSEEVIRPLENSDPKKVELEFDALISRVRADDRERASLMNVQPLRLKEVQGLLDVHQTVIEYFVTPGKTFVWVITKDHISGLSLALGQTELATKINSLRNGIVERKPLRQLHNDAHELFRLLVAPALPYVGGRDLIIVPHSALHYLPFQVLYSEKKRYLVEDYSLTYSSSASLLQFTKAKRKNGKNSIIAFGNPDLGARERKLDFAQIEIKEVQKIFPQTTVFTGRDANEKASKNLGTNYDILHFATHAELDEKNPLASRLLLTAGDREDGNLEVREIFEMNLKASLVVLSGCETGLGKISRGDEVVGLTRAFIYAGTSSVIASLWKVDDASTAHLMGSFYRNLKSKTKVESLRQAQLDMIRGKTNSRLFAQRGVGGIAKVGEAPAAKSSNSITTSHPYFWAPFILVGDGK